MTAEHLGLSADFELPEGVVHLWWASVADHQAQLPFLRTLLSDDERQRADRYLVEPPRRSFTVAHALLRLLLARYVGCSPQELRFAYSDLGKPSLAEPRPQTALDFNLSHSGDLIVAGFATTELGADVEQLRPIPEALSLTKRFFTAQEHTTLQSLARNQHSHAFLRCWTFKEAYLKAIGSGIGGGLDVMEATMDPADPPRIVRVSGSTALAARWCLLSCQPCPSYLASVVVPAGDWRLQVRQIHTNTLVSPIVLNSER